MYNRRIKIYFSDVKIIKGAEIGLDHLLWIGDTQNRKIKKL